MVAGYPQHSLPLDGIKELIKEEILHGGIREEVASEWIKDYPDLFVKKGGRYRLEERYRAALTLGLLGGVFDGIHLGHVRMLKEAKSQVDMLVVVVARDEIARRKGRLIHTLMERVELVSSVKYVDLALPGRENPQETVELVKPSVIFYGYDQKPLPISYPAKVVRLSPYAPERLKSRYFRNI